MQVKTHDGSYDITFDQGGLNRASKIFDLNRKVLIVTDDGVPGEYAGAVAAWCKEPVVSIFPQGEKSKCFETYEKLLREMVDHEFSRHDCVVAVGGGVVGDLAGFVAASYMRGVDFYNIPTTVLAQVDSSVGGKTAIDFAGLKNIVGAFWQPKGVLVDSEVLSTLQPRHISEGLAEAIKMAATSDAKLFEDIEEDGPEIEEIIERAVAIKKDVVEKDEREGGLRKVLNFGHTIGHAIESQSPNLYHGECVAIGMLYMCAPEVRERLEAVLERFGLPTKAPINKDAIISAMKHDKKRDGDKITCVYVPEIGSFEFKDMTVDEIGELL